MELVPSNFPASRSQRGAALLEFAVVVPLLIVFFVGVVDLGRALITYMKLAQVAGEGIRMAGGRAMLEAGQFNNLFESGACSASSSEDPRQGCPGQFNLQARMHNMISLYSLDLSAVEIHSVYDNTTNADNPTVLVRISANYNGILPLFRELPIRAQKSGSYLF